MSGTPLPAPSDAQLDDLDMRRRWLASVEVHNVLPREGMLFVPGPAPFPAICVSAEGIQAYSDLDTARWGALGSAERVALTLVWQDAWSADAPPAEPSSTGALLLHYRGLFRAMVATPEVLAFLQRCLSGAADAGA